MTVQSATTPYQSCMQRNALGMYPEDPAEFRALWTQPGTVAWVQDVVNALTDQQLATLAESLRGTFLQAPSRVMDLWVLAQHTAGLR